MESLRCIAEIVTYQNPDNGFCVIKASVKGEDDYVPLVGKLFNISIGAILQVEGEWVMNRRFGRQFSVSRWEEIIPSTVYGLQRYLGSGAIKGIGKKMAEVIVEAFGVETIDVIADEKRYRELEKLPGIGKKRARYIHEEWLLKTEEHKVRAFLEEHNVSPAFARKVFEKYGVRSIEVIKQNPYRLADEFKGIGFKLADRVAETLGIGKEHPFRCQSGVRYVLSRLSSDEGHVYYPEEMLVRQAAMELSVGRQHIIDALSVLAANKAVIIEEDRVYTHEMYWAEKRVAKRVAALSCIDRASFVSVTEAYAVGKRFGFSYDAFQAEALCEASSSGFMVLTGGPGTGKTTTVQGILKVLKNAGKKVLLAAPTGRAAKRMEEATGQTAKTIHRLLEYSPKDGIGRNAQRPLEGDALIIDESSMIDIYLMDMLLDAVPDGMSVLLVGDIDQLPSVGPGNILRDIIDSGVCPVKRLTHIFRQALTSNIIVNAHRVNKGLMPKVDNTAGSDFFYMERGGWEPGDVADLIVDLVSRRLPNSFHIPASDIQVLSPTRKGAAGTVALNILLQKALNPGKGGVPYGGAVYRPGDKVIQLKNDYDKGVFNGDIGIVKEACNEDGGWITVGFDGASVMYCSGEMDELTHAYATTIHKSQGSEYPVVVMPILSSHYVMLQRNLLYTGITRAKRVLVLVGSDKAVAIAVNNQAVLKRYTYLTERLRADAGIGAAKEAGVA